MLLTGLKGAIFDLDGTLLDSMWVWAAVDRTFLGARGFAVPEDYVEAISHLGLTAAAEYTIARFGLRETVADISAEWNDLARTAYEEQVALKPHAKEYLLRLKARGMRLAAATAIERGDVLAIPIHSTGSFRKLNMVVSTMYPMSDGCRKMIRVVKDMYNV